MLAHSSGPLIAQTQYDIRKGAVTLTTERLVLRSTTREDEPFFRDSIYGDSEVMRYDMDGTIRPPEWVAQKVDLLVKQWQAGEFFGNFTVCLKGQDDSCGRAIGLIRIGDRETIGSPLLSGLAKMAYLYEKSVWGKGYGAEAAQALIGYVSQLAKANVLLRGEPFKDIVATVHPKNLGSLKILQEKLSMRQPRTREEEARYGPAHEKPPNPADERFTFFLTRDDLPINFDGNLTE